MQIIMKKLLVLGFLMLSVCSLYGGSMVAEFEYTEPEVSRRDLVREFIDLGFNVTQHAGRVTMLEAPDPVDGYFYQVWLTRSAKGVRVTAYVFMKPQYHWKFRIGEHEAIEKMGRYMVYCSAAAAGTRYPELYLR
jgi:hypothetical protein